MISHPLFTHELPVGMITGDAPRFQSAPGGHEALKRDLDAAGAQYEETEGCYGGVERSLLVYGLPRDQLTALGKKYGQEAVIHSEGGQRHFIYTNGPHDGRWHPGRPTHEQWPEGGQPPEDNWTRLPGAGYVRLHFDFDQLHPQPGTQAVPQHAAAAPVGKHEVAHRLYETLRKAGEMIQFPKRNPHVEDYTRRIWPQYQQQGYALTVRHDPQAGALHADLTYKGKHAGTLSAPYVAPGKIGAVAGKPGDILSEDHPLYENMTLALRHRADQLQHDLAPADPKQALGKLLELERGRPDPMKKSLRKNATVGVEDVARSYAHKTGLAYAPPSHQPADPAFLGRLAAAYETAPHQPSHPEVKAAYDALKRETLDQYQHLLAHGYRFTPHPKAALTPAAFGDEHTAPSFVHHDGAPYKDMQELLADLHQNKHLYVFDGGELPHDHPLAEPVPGGGPLRTYNDVFRAVHDVFGHGRTGADFGHHGEDRTWQSHMQMYSPLAQRALTTETRGQNATFHFGTHGAHNRANPAQARYADQKAALMPEEFHALPSAPVAKHEVGRALHKTLTEVLDKTSWNVKQRRRYQFAPGADKPSTTTPPVGYGTKPEPVHLTSEQVEARRKKFAQSIGLQPRAEHRGSGFPQSYGGADLPYGREFGVEHETAHAMMVPPGKALADYQRELSLTNNAPPSMYNRSAEDMVLDPENQAHVIGTEQENTANMVEPHVDRRAGVDPHAFASAYRTTDARPMSLGRLPYGVGEALASRKTAVPGGEKKVDPDHIRQDARAYVQPFDEGARFDDAGRVQPPRGVDAKINARARSPVAHLIKQERNLVVTSPSAVPSKFEENAVSDEKKLSIPETLHGLYNGLKQRIARFESTCLDLRKAEQAALEKSLKKGALGDGGFADPSTEKGHANKALGKNGYGEGSAEPMAMAEACKMCGEKGCDCAKAEAYAKNEGNPAAYGPGGSSMPPPMAKAELCKACGMSKAEHDCDKAEAFAKGEIKATWTSREEAKKQREELEAKGKKPDDYKTSVPVKKDEIQPAGASPDGPQPPEGKTPDDKKSKAAPKNDGNGELAKAGMAMPGAPAAPKAAAPKMPAMPKLPGPKGAGAAKPPALGAGKPAPNLKSELQKDLTWSPASKPTGPMPSPFGATPPPAPPGVAKPMKKAVTLPGFKAAAAKKTPIGASLAAAKDHHFGADTTMQREALPVAADVEEARAMQPVQAVKLPGVRAKVGATMDSMLGAPAPQPAAPHKPTDTLPASGMPVKGPIVGGPMPKPAQGVQTMAERVASRVPAKPAAAPGFTPPPPEARPGAAPPPSAAKPNPTQPKKS